MKDTEFLAGANIMDYSLLVGVNDERKELVVGIVGMYSYYRGNDAIRQGVWTDAHLGLLSYLT